MSSVNYDLTCVDFPVDSERSFLPKGNHRVRVPIKKFVKSRFCKTVKLWDGSYALLSGLTGAIYVANRRVLELINTWNRPNYARSSEDRKLRRIIPELVRSGILVEESTDEQLRIQQTMEKIRMTMPFRFTFVLNKMCNFRCIYCFEGEIKGGVMSRKTVDDCIDMTIKCVKKSGQHFVAVTMFGGEPLMSVDLLRYVMRKLRRGLPSRSVVVGKVVTNGSLLTRETINVLADEAVDVIQVSIDGTRMTHNKRRPFKNGNGSFDSIMEGVKLALSAGINVDIRIAIDKQNIHNIPSLLHYLAAEHLGQPGLRIAFARVHATTEVIRAYKNNVLPLQRFSDEWLKLYKIAAKYGFNVYVPLFRFLHCEAYTQKNLIFDVDGSLLTCCEGLGHQGSFVIGNVHNRPMYNPYSKRFFTYSPFENRRCKKCQMVTFCGGGCISEEQGGRIPCPFFRYNFREHVNAYISEKLNQSRMAMKQ